MPICRTAALAAALVLATAACSRHEAPAEATSSDSAMPQASMAKAESAPAAAPEAARADGVQRAGDVDPAALGSSALTAEVGTRRFIRTVDVDFQVQDVQRAARRTEDLAARFGGFVTRSDVESDVRDVQRRSLGNGRLVELSVYVQRADLQVRVPSAQAQAFMRTLASEMEFLDRRQYRAVDAQFELLRQQLARARHSIAQRDLARAAQAGGGTGENVMAIEAASGAALARDEALLAEKTFEDQVAFATIDLAMQQPERVRRSERPDVSAILANEGPGFFRRAASAMAAGWSGLLEVVLVVVALWPMWLGAGLALLAWRSVRRWRRAARSA